MHRCACEPVPVSLYNPTSLFGTANNPVQRLFATLMQVMHNVCTCCIICVNHMSILQPSGMAGAAQGRPHLLCYNVHCAFIGHCNLISCAAPVCLIVPLIFLSDIVCSLWYEGNTQQLPVAEIQGPSESHHSQWIQGLGIARHVLPCIYLAQQELASVTAFV